MPNPKSQRAKKNYYSFLWGEFVRHGNDVYTAGMEKAGSGIWPMTPVRPREDAVDLTST